MKQGPPPTPEELNDLLTKDLERLVRYLFPNARREGQEYSVGSIYGEKGQSLRINVGSKRGTIRDFASGEGYDPFKLAAAVQFDGDYKRTYRWAISWLGLDDADPERIERVKREAREEARARDLAAERERAERNRKAQAIYLSANPLERGDTVDRYLLSRAIDLAELGHAPGALRCHPGLDYWRPAAGGRYEKAGTYPAMIGRITSLDGSFMGAHCTWLLPDGSGKVGADEVGLDHRGRPNKAKKIKGEFRGGHIKLWLGQRDDGRRIRGSLRTMKGSRLHLSEGIEDGLTAACADPALAVAVAISVGNLQTIALPDQASEIVLLKQNDPPGSDAAKAYLKGVARLRDESRRVLEIAAPGDSKDINDLAQSAVRRPLERHAS